MNRNTVAAIVATALVGTIGGGLAAVVRGDNDKPVGPAAGSNETPGSGKGALLYAGNKTIHDGDTTVTYDAPFDTPDRLVRTADGWLISNFTDVEEPWSASRVYRVAPDGETTVIAEIVDAFDLNAEGDRFVATDLESNQVKVWGIDGEVQQTWKPPPGTTRPVWSGDTVFASAIVDTGGSTGPGGETGAWALFRWDPVSGESQRLDRFGLARMGASSDGKLLSGSVDVEGYSVPGPNYCLGVMPTPGQPDHNSWDTCDWRLNGGRSEGFSPDGKRLLAVPSETDGFGPGMFATFSATAGPSEGLKKFLTPDLTMDGTWLDNDTLALAGATDFDLDDDTGGWIQTCDLSGKCTEVATQDKGLLVLGEQG